MAQKRYTKDKIDSLHEHQTCCISNGKEHKKYEFDNKASFVKTDTGVTVGALGLETSLVGKAPAQAKVDRGYRGNTKMVTQIYSYPQRAGIEPDIVHIQANHRLTRNFYKGIAEENINIMLAAAGFNFKRIMNKWKSSFWHFLKSIFQESQDLSFNYFYYKNTQLSVFKG